MSEHHGATESFFDRYWQVCVIAFAVVLVAFFAFYGPVSTGIENMHVNSTNKMQQSEPDGIKP